MDYGFVIDNRRCIGCHACTVACKAEHEIPLGVFRTWVKYVEEGFFPDVRRYFTVLRCNHCKVAPCVNICPTRALFHRDDGIVDFNNEYCIACKACMAACPYDAIYIDPKTKTAAKCNYCAHKIEIGLEPACVTVCPEQAIIAGALNDPQSAISQLIARHETTLRKPEQRTQPKVHYVEGHGASLTAGAAPKATSYLWAERPSWEKAADFTTQKGPGTACTTYDVPHRRPWGLRVSLYLWTKSLSAGPILVAALLTLFGRVRAPVLFGQVAPALALIFIMLTALLLIGDLERPERFPKILLHPNPRSWLVWGSHILIFYSVIAILWLLFGTTPVYRLVLLLLWPGLVFSVLAAGYSAFLLTQARARELWQSRLLFPHLIIQAFLAGSAMLSLGALYEDSGRLLTDLLLRCLLVGLIVHGILILCEMALSRSGRDAAAAVTSMILGPQAGRFWTLAIFGGIALPIYLLSFYFLYPGPGSLLPVLSCAGVLAGLLVFEDCYMRAGQAPPLS